MTTTRTFSLKAICLAALLAQGALAQAQTAPAVTEPTLPVQRYVIEGDNPLSADETRALLAPYTGDKRTMGDIEAAANALEKAIRDRGFAFHRMFIPVQKPTDGEIRLQVIGIKLGAVEVTGNEFFTAENVRRSLTSLKEGEVPEVQVLGRDVTASNANPAKQISVTFKESEQPGLVDATVRVKDTNPLVFFTTLTANQSVYDGHQPQNNVYRITGGMQHSNLFDRDQVVTLSYTTDPGDINDVSLFGAYYQVPLYGTGMNLSASYVRSDIDSGTVQQGAGVFNVSGSGTFIGVRLTRALNRVNALQQTIGIALDDRFFRNSSTFNGNKISPDVGSRVLTLQYSFRDEPSWGDLAGGVDLATNIGAGPGNSGAAHTANGGSRNWSALRFNIETAFLKTDWQVLARLKGQYTAKSLIAGEQFGLGGAGTVRGFADRVVSGDVGYQWNVEALGPSIDSYPLRPVVFFEGGRVRTNATGATETITSVGAGLRMYLKNLQASLDLAQVLDPQRAQVSGLPRRLHLSVSYRF